MNKFNSLIYLPNLCTAQYRNPFLRPVLPKRSLFTRLTVPVVHSSPPHTSRQRLPRSRFASTLSGSRDRRASSTPHLDETVAHVALPCGPLLLPQHMCATRRLHRPRGRTAGRVSDSCSYQTARQKRQNMSYFHPQASKIPAKVIAMIAHLG